MIAALPEAVRAVAEAVLDGRRIDSEQALLLSYEADLHTLMRLAHAVRMVKAAERGEVENGVARVTYVVDRNINYSNICSCGCMFCAFFAAPGNARGYVLSHQELERKVEETVTLGGSQILMQGGHHPDLPFSFYEEMLGLISSRFPSIHI
ncbi:MAG: radical SAM protein, partial [Oceanidesulfovibrio sp.]